MGICQSQAVPGITIYDWAKGGVTMAKTLVDIEERLLDEACRLAKSADEA
jgi:hypothetical protein